MSRMAQLFSQGPMCARHANQGTNAGTNDCRIATARNNPKVVSGNDRKALESCTFTDLLVAVGTVGVSLAVKRFVGSSPIASTRKCRSGGILCDVGIGQQILPHIFPTSSDPAMP